MVESIQTYYYLLVTNHLFTEKRSLKKGFVKQEVTIQDNSDLILHTTAANRNSFNLSFNVLEDVENSMDEKVCYYGLVLCLQDLSGKTFLEEEKNYFEVLLEDVLNSLVNTNGFALLKKAFGS